jgi:uncharacterized protein YndB with AHSA1/START domain
MDDHGVVTAPGTLRLERLLPGPIERVWAYITESDKRGQWLASGPMELKPGGAARLEFRHAELSPVKEEVPEKYKRHANGATVTGRILRCEPPRLLSMTWEHGSKTEVTFELTPKGDEVLLVVTHRRLEDRGTLIGVSGGWHTHLGILVDRLNGRTPRPFWTVYEEHDTYYTRQFADAPLAQGGAR